MRKFYAISLFLLMICLGCQLQMRPSDDEQKADGVVIERFDRVEGIYLALGDYAALQQMKTDYPLQTRTLVEDVLQLGQVNAPGADAHLLSYFRDNTLQTLIADVGREYSDVEYLNRQFTNAFQRLKRLLPEVEIPTVYTQIGSLDQSIVVAGGMLGVSLDKYLGADYPVYLRYGYSEQQRSMMSREYIVPDAVGFYLLSLYPLPDVTEEELAAGRRHWHMKKIQTVVNQILGQRFFTDETIEQLERYRKSHPQLSVDGFLRLDSIPF